MADFTIPCPVLAHIKASVVFPEKFSRRKCKDKCVMSNWQQIGFKVMKFDFYGYTGPKSYIFGFSSLLLCAYIIVCLDIGKGWEWWVQTPAPPQWKFIYINSTITKSTPRTPMPLQTCNFSNPLRFNVR